MDSQPFTLSLNCALNNIPLLAGLGAVTFQLVFKSGNQQAETACDIALIWYLYESFIILY